MYALGIAYSPAPFIRVGTLYSLKQAGSKAHGCTSMGPGSRAHILEHNKLYELIALQSLLISDSFRADCFATAPQRGQNIHELRTIYRLFTNPFEG